MRSMGRTKKMKKNLFYASFTFFVISTAAFAHIEPGVYRGQTSSGEACEFTAIDQYFEGGVKHPLNERIRIEANGTRWVMAHPPVIDLEQSTAFFNHDLFQSVQPTQTGAIAFIIEMKHEGANEGPVAFQVITHHWKTGKHEGTRCFDLKKLERSGVQRSIQGAGTKRF